MFPHERSLVARLKDKPFALIGVNSDKDKTELAAKSAEAQITWRSFWNGPKGTGGPISTTWNVQGWPTLFLIDHEGKILNRWLGNPGDEVLDAAIDKAVKLAEAAPQDEKGAEKKRETSSNADVDTLDSLRAEHESYRETFSKAMQDAEGDDKKQDEIFGAYRKQIHDYALRGIALADRAATNAEKAALLLWVGTELHDPESEAAVTKAFLGDLKEEEAAGDFACFFLPNIESKTKSDDLDWFATKSPHASVRAKALFAKARMLKAPMRRGDVSPEVRAEIEKLFETVVRDHADVDVRYYGKLGAAAERELFEMRRLSIGAVAPEIAGVDTDGVEFKLSDYRGKVVMLDFWGHW